MTRPERSLRILSVAAEFAPLAKIGGLGDVVAALPGALAAENVAVGTLVPGYPSVLEVVDRTLAPVAVWDDLLGLSAVIRPTRVGGAALLVLDIPGLFDLSDDPYVDADGREWPDLWRRFGALACAAARLGADPGQGFDLVHAHDWHAALVPAYLAELGSGLPSVLTIHNLAHQGHYDPQVRYALGLTDPARPDQPICFLRSGIELATQVTTVSPNYAQEILTQQHGMGLDQSLTGRRNGVIGIVNGIDPEQWNARRDPLLVQNFASERLDLRRANRSAIEQAFALGEDDGPLFVVVSRLSWQKGTDLIASIADRLIANGARLAVLGTGDPAHAAALADAAARHPGRIGLRAAFDEPLAHVMFGGGDALLVPSRFEPCGLTQLYAQAYGCVPLVAATGGLVDTVIDAAAARGTGFVFAPDNAEALKVAIDRALSAFAQPAQWQRLQRGGMARDSSWAPGAAAYRAVFDAIVPAGQPETPVALPTLAKPPSRGA